MADAIVLAHRHARGLAEPKKPTASEQRVTASNDAMLLAEVAAGYHPDPERIAAQICACYRKAHGQVSPPLPGKGTLARRIIQAHYEAIGRTE